MYYFIPVYLFCSNGSKIKKWSKISQKTKYISPHAWYDKSGTFVLKLMSRSHLKSLAITNV